MKIIGLRIEKYISQEVSGHNCDFEYTDANFEKHIICGLLSNNKKVEIELSRSEGQCGSGWCTASWGHIDVKEVTKFNGYTHTPKEPMYIDDILPNFDDNISNNVFTINYDGGDSYYPRGYYSVDMNLFNVGVRAKEFRPVWIFMGDSNTGKSFLSSKIKDIEVYETDTNSELPDTITASIIVVGNKYKFNINDIKSKLFGDVEIHDVSFSNSYKKDLKPKFSHPDIEILYEEYDNNVDEEYLKKLVFRNLNPTINIDLNIIYKFYGYWGGEITHECNNEIFIMEQY